MALPTSVRINSKKKLLTVDHFVQFKCSEIKNVFPGEATERKLTQSWNFLIKILALKGRVFFIWSGLRQRAYIGRVCLIRRCISVNPVRWPVQSAWPQKPLLARFATPEENASSKQICLHLNCFNYPDWTCARRPLLNISLACMLFDQTHFMLALHLSS